MLLHTITPARKFSHASHTNPNVSEGYTPGPSLTLRVSMTFFVAGVICSDGTLES